MIIQYPTTAGGFIEYGFEYAHLRNRRYHAVLVNDFVAKQAVWVVRARTLDAYEVPVMVVQFGRPVLNSDDGPRSPEFAANVLVHGRIPTWVALLRAQSSKLFRRSGA